MGDLAVNIAERVEELNTEPQLKPYIDLPRMMENVRDIIKRATRLIFIPKYLERLADHATNVAEEVIYAVQGRDVRHGHGTGS
jgi:phosphate transport system protein